MHITKINGINNFTSNYKSTFRDEELFDESIDNITSGYSSYDGYDTSLNDLIDDSIDYYYPNRTDDRTAQKRQLINYLNLYGQVDNPIIYNNVEKNREIYDLCVIENDDSKRFLGNLYNHLIKYSDKYSNDQIRTVIQSSKLFKANSKEYIDYNLLEAGFEFIKKFPKASNEDIEDLMNSLIAKDKKGNEIFILNASDFAQGVNNESIKDCIKAVEAGMICDDNGVYQDFSFGDASRALYRR